MKSEEKSKAQLIKELAEIHNRFSELEKLLRLHRGLGEALMESEELYHILFQTSPEAIILTDLNYNIVVVNQNMVRISGFENVHEMVGMNTVDLISEKDKGRVKENFKKALEKGYTGDIEYSLVRKDGTPVDAEMGISSIVDMEGHPRAFLVVARSITERKRIEEALRREKDMAEKYLNIAGVIFLVLDTNGGIRLINQKGCHILEYTKEELVGKNWFDTCMPASIREDERSVFQRLVSGEVQSIEYYEESAITKNGKERVVAWYATILKDESGVTTGILASGEDITERKHVAEELRVLERALEQSMDGIAITDMNGIIHYVNNSWAKMHGYSVVELLGNPLALFHIDEQFYSEVVPFNEKVIKFGAYSGEMSHLRKDGSTFPAWISSTVLRDSQGKPTGLVVIARDITERKRADRALKYRMELERLISTISTQFINLPLSDIDKGINHALQTVGEFTLVDRSYVFLFSLDATQVDNTHEWCAGGVEPRKDKLQHLAVEDIPWFMDKISKFEVVYVPRVSELPPAANVEKEQLQSMGVQSLILVPMIYGGGLIGFLGLDSVRQEKSWSEDVVSLLRIVGYIFVNTLERKWAEEAIRESEEKYRNVVERANDGIIIIQDSLLKYANPRIAEMTGYSTQETANTPFTNYIHPDELPRVVDYYKNRLAGKKVPERYEAALRHKSGAKVYVELSAGSITYKENPADLVIIRDITERKRAEEALAAEKERLAVTLRSIGDGVIATDTEGTIVLLNKVAEELTGWRHEEAVGKPFGEVFRIFDEKTGKPGESPVEKVIRTGGVVEFVERVLVAKDSTQRMISDSAAPIRDRESKIVGVVLVFRDITEKLLMEEELLKSRKLESIGILAGGIAHDFNNILTAILTNISLAKMMQKEEDDITQVLQESEKAALQGRDLTYQLLTFSKGGAPIKKTASIEELIKDSVNFVLTGSNVKCDFKIPGDLWIAKVDRGQISQVINNLIINACQAMPEGGTVTVGAENVDVSTENNLPLGEGKYIKIFIEDHGVGIPKEHMSKIFDPYFSTKSKGSGLGLTTSYSIVKKHGGCINVESEIGKGSLFCVYLPVSGSQVVIKDKEFPKMVKGQGKVLLMDDEAIIRKSTGKLITQLGYEVDFAENGAQAIEMYKEAKEEGFPFDVVIMDLTIPGGMGGKEAIRRLLEYDPAAKAVASSGYSNDPIMADYTNYGFKGVVAKPYEIEEMSETLHRVILGTED